MHSQPLVWVFFYGTFINPDVCATADAKLRDVELAQLHGFDIQVGPLANLVRSEQRSVYGIIARMNHEELGRLYTMNWVGTYLPEAVLVKADQRWVSALTYIKPEMASAPAPNDYIDRIVHPGRGYGFPEWYLQRIESFRSPPHGR